jgi:hypothetical protein
MIRWRWWRKQPAELPYHGRPESIASKVAEWAGRPVGAQEDEQQADFLIRRASAWAEFTSSTVWSEMVQLIVRSRDGVIAELCKGTPNRYNERGDDEKRAMIYAFNIVLGLPVEVERQGAEARRAVTEFERRKLRGV